MGAPISGFANTPFATVMARVARVVGDGSDSDRAPDFLPASGEIVFTPNIKFSKLEVDNKSVIVLNEPVRCTIDPVLGYMIGPDGGLGVRLVASSGVNIEPQGLGYTVSFRGMETRIPDFSIFLEAGEVVDLAKLLPVDLQPGIVTTVSSKTVDAVEQALIRLNSLQENVSYTVKSIPDMFRWDGTTLLINGNPGPDLGRITDEKLEDINNTIDSLLQAQSDLVIDSIEAQQNFNELDDKLGQAFPDDIFDVDLAIEQAKDLADEAAKEAESAALAYADLMKQEAIDAGALDLANLQIGGRNLIVASTLDRKKYLRETGVFEVFASYATTDFIPASPNTHYVHSGDSGLGTKPSTVFYNANKQYLSGLAGSARRAFTTPPGTAFIRTSLKVADLGSIKLERGTKATDWTPAPEDVDAGIADAEAAAKTHATNEAARVKQEALTEAATDAQAKAEAAASAAQQAAEAYALAKAQGLSGQALADAKADAQSKADAARDAAITAAETYADARKNEAIDAAALTAQTKADVAKQAAIEAAALDAQAKAEAAEAAAKAHADLVAQGASADASAAMATADGKNTTSYKTVTTTPGAAPTNAVEGKNRRQFDMHRNRLSNGTIVGEWMWSGSSWVQVHMGDGILRSLDVGKLTAGTANIATAVVNKVWGQLGVFDKLDVRTDAYVSGVNLKNGAVTARTLNVVPEEGSGGLQLTSDGMMVVEADGSGSVDLRVGTDNYLSFYSDDSVNFSVSSDGALTAKDVSANDSLIYRGIELIDFLESMPRGVIYYAEPIGGNHTISNASYTSRIGHIVVERPSTPRHWRIVARAGVQASSSTTYDTSGLHWQFVSNTGQHYDESSWKVLSSVLYQTSGFYWQTETLEQVVNTDDISWNTSGTALVSWTARNAIGSSYLLGQGAIFYIEDVGPAFDRSPTYPWIRPASSTDSGSSTTPTARTGTWNISSFQNYRSGVRLNHRSGNIVGGNLSGEWRGIMLFPHATIASALSGATISKVEVYLQNAHTYTSSGSTVLIGSHNYATAPSSSPSVAARTSQHFSRGQGRWVTLPNAVGDGFKGGTIKGLAVYGSSTANYATWTPSAPKLRITYKK